MAGDWLKMEVATPDKPEVLAITARMGWDDPDLAVGKLFRVWRWFDQHTTDGNAHGVTLALLDRIAGVTGFGAAMQFAGWLIVSDDGISLPNFDRHCGKTAKERAQTAKRVASHKSNAKANAQGNAVTVTNTVTDALPREEKRREEEKEEKIGASPDGEALPLTAERQPAIPYQAIVTAYNATMVNLPKVREISTDRKTAMRKAWMAGEQRQSVEFWRAYFEECAAEPFTNGSGPYTGEHANWRPDFDYLMRGKVITRIFERAMDRLERSAA